MTETSFASTAWSSLNFKGRQKLILRLCKVTDPDCSFSNVADAQSLQEDVIDIFSDFAKEPEDEELLKTSFSSSSGQLIIGVFLKELQRLSNPKPEKPEPISANLMEGINRMGEILEMAEKDHKEANGEQLAEQGLLRKHAVQVEEKVQSEAKQSEETDPARGPPKDTASAPAPAPATAHARPDSQLVSGHEERPAELTEKPAASDRSKDSSESYNVFVADLADVIDESDLVEAFTVAGPITSASIVKDRSTGLSKGYGFLHFSTHEGQQAALQIPEMIIKGRKVTISEPHEKNVLFLGNLPYQLAQDEMRHFLAQNELDEGLESFELKEGRGFGFLKYKAYRFADNAKRVLGRVPLKGRTINPMWATGKRSSDGGDTGGGARGADGQGVKYVFISNLPSDATTLGIEDHFKGFFPGKVEKVVLPQDTTGPTARLRGYGFVYFNDKEAADACVQSMNGRPFMGTELVVELARSRGGSRGRDDRGGDMRGDDFGRYGPKRGRYDRDDDRDRRGVYDRRDDRGMYGDRRGDRGDYRGERERGDYRDMRGPPRDSYYRDERGPPRDPYYGGGRDSRDGGYGRRDGGYPRQSGYDRRAPEYPPVHDDYGRRDPGPAMGQYGSSYSQPPLRGGPPMGQRGPQRDSFAPPPPQSSSAYSAQDTSGAFGSSSALNDLAAYVAAAQDRSAGSSGTDQAGLNPRDPRARSDPRAPAGDPYASAPAYAGNYTGDGGQTNDPRRSAYGSGGGSYFSGPQGR